MFKSTCLIIILIILEPTCFIEKSNGQDGPLGKIHNIDVNDISDKVSDDSRGNNESITDSAVLVADVDPPSASDKEPRDSYRLDVDHVDVPSQGMLYSNTSQGKQDITLKLMTKLDNSTSRLKRIPQATCPSVGWKEIFNYSSLEICPVDSLNISKVGVRGLEKITCLPRVLAANQSARVQIFNGTGLLHWFYKNRDSVNFCFVVLFYADWCTFSAEVGPHYNALARAFPNLDVLALDAYKFVSLNARVGTIALPSIVIFHNVKSVATVLNRTFPLLVYFVANITGIKPNASVKVEDIDYLGPLNSKPVPMTDYYLILSWMFLITLSFVAFTNTNRGHRMLTFFLHIHKNPLAEAIAAPSPMPAPAAPSPMPAPAAPSPMPAPAASSPTPGSSLTSASAPTAVAANPE